MIDKLLKMFFVKKEKANNNSKITIIRKKVVDAPQREVNDDKKLTSITTCLTQYFAKQRGLNVVGRGFTYFFEDSHTN